MGCRITKGVSERSIARLLLTTVKELPKTDGDADIPSWANKFLTVMYDQMQQLNENLMSLNSNFTSLKDSVEKSVEMAHEQANEVTSKVNQLTCDIKQINIDLLEEQKQNHLLKLENQNIKERLIKLESTQRRLELVFEGLK